MIEYKYHFTGVRPTESEVFSDATEAELRVLVALLDLGGCATEEKLCEVSRVSKARVSAAIALWDEAGVIAEGEVLTERGGFANTVTAEYPEDVLLDDLDETSSLETATFIKKRGLNPLYQELQNILKKETFTPIESKKIAQYIAQYGISEEYLLMLAAHMAEQNSDFKLTVSAIGNKIKYLNREGIVSVSELEVYIANKEMLYSELGDYIRIFSNGARKISNREIDYLRKWSKDFGFGAHIVSLAYDITSVNTGKLSYAYIDKLLTDWHENGAKTVAECEKRYIEFRENRDNEADARVKKAQSLLSSKKKKEKPRYGDFDPEEALNRALSRSFFEDDSSDK